MNLITLLEKLKPVFTLALPHIKKLIESKVVPALKRKAYERLNDFSNDRIESLSNLLVKIKNEKNETKKKAHLEGFKLGLSAIEAIGYKLIEASKTLREELDTPQLSACVN